MAEKARRDNRRMGFLKVESPALMNCKVLDKGIVTVARASQVSPDHGYTNEHPVEDAFLIAFQKRDYSGDLWVEGRRVDFSGSREGNFTVYDLKKRWKANLRSAFDCINFHVSRQAFGALEEDVGTRAIETLNVNPGQDITDPVVQGLVRVMVQAFEHTEIANRLLVDHVGTAFVLHMAANYGGAPANIKRSQRSGLAQWQLNRARDLMDANLDGAVSLQDIADQCGLSSAHFAKAFKASTGMPPHRWLINRRIDKAVVLLGSGSKTLKEIADHCGFLDQSHFTRSFKAVVGTTPASWRKSLAGS